MSIVNLNCFDKNKGAWAFFFLFFLHGTFKRRTELSHIAYNGWRICARFNGAYTLLGVWFYFNF